MKMSSSLPSDIKDIISEYKERSFRVTNKSVTLNWSTGDRISHPKINEVRNIPLTLKRGVWHYIMSPFVRRYVNFRSGCRNIYPNRYALARCYTLIFYHSEFDITQFPRDISISNFSPKTKSAFATRLTLCSGNTTPLFNVDFGDVVYKWNKLIPAEQIYSDQEGNYLIIPIAEVNSSDETLFHLQTENKRLREELGKVIVGDYSMAYVFPLPGFDEVDISVKEAKKHGLPWKGGNLTLWAEYDNNDKLEFIAKDSKDKKILLNEDRYPVLQKLASVLNRFRVKNLRHDKIFDTNYRRELLAFEDRQREREQPARYFYNNNPTIDEFLLEQEIMDENWVGEDEEDEDEKDNKDKKTLFEGLVFAVSGKFTQSRSDINKLITTNSGEIVDKIIKDTDIVVSNSLDSKKAEKALEKDKVIVTENWLRDSIKAGKRLPYDEYTP